MKSLLLAAAAVTLSITSAYAADRVKTIVAECDLSKGTTAWAKYDMNTTMDDGYALVTVYQVDNPPSTTPGYVQRKCVYVFAKQPPATQP